MIAWQYTGRGIIVCGRRGAQPAGHLEPAALVRALGGRDRARASAVAALGLQAPARAAGGGVRGFANRSAAAPLSPAAGAAQGARRLAGSLPALLVEARRCPGATPEQDGEGVPEGAVDGARSEGKEEDMSNAEPYA